MPLHNKNINHFENYIGAVTSLYLLSESHLSFHTWPENRYIAMDIFTCGSCDTEKIVFEILYLLKPKYCKIKKIIRNNNIENNNIENNNNTESNNYIFNKESNIYEICNQ